MTFIAIPNRNNELFVDSRLAKIECFHPSRIFNGYYKKLWRGTNDYFQNTSWLMHGTLCLGDGHALSHSAQTNMICTVYTFIIGLSSILGSFGRCICVDCWQWITVLPMYRKKSIYTKIYSYILYICTKKQENIQKIMYISNTLYILLKILEYTFFVVYVLKIIAFCELFCIYATK